MIKFHDWIKNKNVLVCEASASSPSEKQLMRNARSALRYFAIEDPILKFDGIRTKRKYGLYQGDMKKFEEDLEDYRKKYISILNRVKDATNVYNSKKKDITDLFDYYKSQGKDPIFTVDFTGETGPSF